MWRRKHSTVFYPLQKKKMRKRRNLWIVKRKLMSVNKQLLKALLLTNPCIKEEWENTYSLAEANSNQYAFYCIPCK